MKLNVTSKAISELKKVMAKKDALDKKVRVYVAGFG